MTPADLAYRQLRLAHAANRAGLTAGAAGNIATARAYLALTCARPFGSADRGIRTARAYLPVSAASVRESLAHSPAEQQKSDHDNPRKVMP